MECYFFGTFNPIHLGHLKIAELVKEKCGFKKVIFVPSYIPPHKNNLLDYSHRLNMARLCSKDVSDIESKLETPSYTYRTIEKLYEENNNQKINFIIGYDQFFSLEKWMKPEILKQKLRFIVIPRREDNKNAADVIKLNEMKNLGYDFKVLNIDFLDISSSKIRELARNKKDLTNLVTKEVNKYIENNRLYN